MSKTIRPEAARDIKELQGKIESFKNGEIPEDKFKHFRLTRGVYGQRQAGVQMIRIKLPAGRFTAGQLRAMARVSDKYATGNLHLTTRQDIQLHFVKLEDSPQLWAELEEEEVTLREACGNTVRNVTASPEAGVDPDEAFDVTPYALSFAHYFLRNPICQDMGRKFKVAFSSSEADSAFTYFHDIGFIPRVHQGVRGFKVVVGGGLGAQPHAAKEAFEFLPVNEMIPFAEAVLRVFDRYGERSRRHKARMKFLLKELGLHAFIKLVEEQRSALRSLQQDLDLESYTYPVDPAALPIIREEVEVDEQTFANWKKSNVQAQKEADFFVVRLRVHTGDIKTPEAFALADLVEQTAADDIRVTVNQGLLLRYVPEQNLPYLYQELKKLGLADAGFDSTHDITACPGSDTCNLAVTNSTGLTGALEEVLQDEYAELVQNKELKIKISGCMNACGQHTAAQIGFHGSSIRNRKTKKVAPAMQVLLGGGLDPKGEGHIADKVIKLPTKRIPDALRLLLDEYEKDALSGELFQAFYQRLGKMHFYHLLKDLADPQSLTEADFMDWGAEEQFEVAVGTGECAGISLDLVETVLNEAKEKFLSAQEGLEHKAWADAIYNSYSGMVITAKALLLAEEVECNRHTQIVADFDEHFLEQGKLSWEFRLKELVKKMDDTEPSEAFAGQFFAWANALHEAGRSWHKGTFEGTAKEVISDYYKA